MKRHKPLKSVSHNFGNSLVSCMNHIEDNYFLGHLLKQARKTKCSKLEVDILNKEMSPAKLLTKPVIKSLNNWISLYPDMVERSGSSMDYVKSAKLTIEFNLNESRLDSTFKKYIENPYVCEVVIIDDKGKVYNKKQEGWWFPET
ncbi:MAG: hypothetical protein PHN88_01485 [Ignavibacteria bacterium]|nr:hypothetical protein [Ignavibacteria bacterium]